MMLGHAASSGVCAGQKSSRESGTPILSATSSTIGFSASGILPRSFQLWTVETGLLSARAIRRTPPNAATIFETYDMRPTCRKMQTVVNRNMQTDLPTRFVQSLAHVCK